MRQLASRRVWQYYIRRAEEDPGGGREGVRVVGFMPRYAKQLGQIYSIMFGGRIMFWDVLSSFSSWIDQINHLWVYHGSLEFGSMLVGFDPAAGWLFGPGSGPEVYVRLYLDHSEHYPALVKPLPEVPDLLLSCIRTAGEFCRSSVADQLEVELLSRLICIGLCRASHR